MSAPHKIIQQDSYQLGVKQDSYLPCSAHCNLNYVTQDCISLSGSHSYAVPFSDQSFAHIRCFLDPSTFDIYTYLISFGYFFKKINLFIYLFLAALGLRCYARAFSSCGERGLLFIAVRRLLVAVASLVAEHGL